MACGGAGWTGDGWRDEDEEDKTGRGRGKPVKGGGDRDEEEEDAAVESGSPGQVGQDGDRTDGKTESKDRGNVEEVAGGGAIVARDRMWEPPGPDNMVDGVAWRHEGGVW